MIPVPSTSDSVFHLSFWSVRLPCLMKKHQQSALWKPCLLWRGLDAYKYVSCDLRGVSSKWLLSRPLECHYFAVGFVHVSCLVGLMVSLQLDLRPTLHGVPDPLGGRSSKKSAHSASMRMLEPGLDPARLLARVLHLLDGLDWCLKHQYQQLWMRIHLVAL